MGVDFSVWRMSSNLRVQCSLTCGNDTVIFTADSYDEKALERAKPVEVNTEHSEGPLKDCLEQLEKVQVQVNHQLTQIVERQRTMNKSNNPQGRESVPAKRKKLE